MVGCRVPESRRPASTIAPAIARRFAAALGVVLGCAVATPALSQPRPGEPAPPFTLQDVAGKSVSLAAFKGRTVVLEWTNPGCPFVQKHYVSRNMPALQAKYGATDVVWLSINSTHSGHVDYLEPAQLAARMQAWQAAPTAILMDTDGATGKAYGARTTPQMVVIDAGGVIRYAGAIDDRRSADPADVKVARNYVSAALDDLKAGRPVALASSTPYGCSVKYR